MPDAANLTPVGIGGWTEADFKTAIRDGRRPNGTTDPAGDAAESTRRCPMKN